MRISQHDNVTMDELRGALSAIAPLVGTTKLISTADNLIRAYGIGLVVQEFRDTESQPSMGAQG